MLGGGFTAESIKRGIAMGATAIAIDAGSTDSGPHYLGAGVAKTSDSAVARDLRILLVAARENRIPLIVGSCGTSGTDAGVDQVAAIAERIAAEDRLSFRMARIYSELRPETVIAAIDEGRVRALPPSGELGPGTVRSCAHIVALMGHAPIAAALEAGAEVVLAGRATDTAMVAAVALMHGRGSGLACRQDRRVRRPVHHQAHVGRRLRQHRRHRLHRHAAGLRRRVHADHRRRAHDVRERRPVPPA
jgi:hypothetical protein